MKESGDIETMIRETREKIADTERALQALWIELETLEHQRHDASTRQHVSVTRIRKIARKQRR